MSKRRYIISEMSIVIMFQEGDSYTINSSHANFKKIASMIVDASTSDGDIKDLLNTKKAIEKWSKGDLVITGGSIYYGDLEIHNMLVNKILSMMDEGDKGFKRFARFLKKTLQNPSFKARKRLMEFAAADNIDIDKKGNILAFKNTDSYGYSKHRGEWVKKDGTWEYKEDSHYFHEEDSVCEMPREEVDDNETNTCSTGLHICSLHYLKTMWGTSGTNWLVMVNPKDIIAIPPDYNNSKARVCKYTVVEEIENINEIISASNL